MSSRLAPIHQLAPPRLAPVYPLARPLLAGLAVAVALAALGDAAQAATWPSAPDAALQRLLERAVRIVRARHGAQRPRLRVAVVDLSDPAQPRRASVGGETSVYAASLVKLAFALTYFDEAAAGRVARSARGDELVRRSLGPYDNRSPSLLVDLATGTRPGPALRGAALREFVRRRGAPNRLLDRHGLRGFRAVQKVSGGSGRERQLGRLGGNKASADDVAKLLWLLWEGQLVGADAKEKLLAAMRGEGGRKDLIAYPLRSGLPAGVTIHSKAGWTRRWAHDAALVVPPRGGPYIVVALSQVDAPGAHLATLARELHRALRPPEPAQ